MATTDVEKERERVTFFFLLFERKPPSLWDGIESLFFICLLSETTAEQQWLATITKPFNLFNSTAW